MNTKGRNSESEKLLTGKVAVITGAGRPNGIGWATAIRMAEHGANVVVTDIVGKEAETGGGMAGLNRLRTEIEGLGRNALSLTVDVTRMEDITTCVEETNRRFGGIDILFNNAGTPDGVGPYLEQTDHHWDLSYQVNLKGMANFCRVVIPVMIARGGGSIINNSSLAGLGTIAGFAAYAATKFGVIGLTKTIAAEFGPQNVRCNAICPGLILTDMAHEEIRFFMDQSGQSFEETKREMSEEVPLKRWGTPGEIADVVVFLSGPQSRYVTGVALPVAGGLAPGL